MRSAADASGSWSENERSPSRPSLLTVALVFIAVLWTSAFIVFSLGADLLAWDVRFAYLPAADAILDGRSPYPALDDPILEDQKGYVYPPQLAVVLLPLTKLPIDLVALIVTAGMLAMLWLTLRLLGIRDVRCYAAAVLWMPVASGVLLANVSIPLALALAVDLEVSRAGSESRRSHSASRCRRSSSSGRCSCGRSRHGASAPLLGRSSGRPRHVRGLGGDRLRRARRLPRPPATALRHPVREQLLDRRHGVDTRAQRDRGSGPHRRHRRRIARRLRRPRPARRRAALVHLRSRRQRSR